MRMVFPHSVSGRFMDELASDMSNLVETLLGDARNGGASRRTGATSEDSKPQPRWPVPVDVIETETDFQILADLPGVDAAAIELEVQDEQVTLVANRPNAVVPVEPAEGEPAEGEPTEGQPTEGQLGNEPSKMYTRLRSERRFGEYRRVFQLPAPVDQDAVTATYVDGVLSVTLPKLVEKNTARRVEVIRQNAN
ncbi:Hsp20/alpha crystallin family protein [Stieleria varia]|uniref:18 kDa heat shock protein n=1 Tax=Stieleria varia TaxID=2528005 RepID=A0A5C6B7P7_9BACT|nr:Hsp20/alpha crystallin family protein [Stieleria varia]TWU08285.1 18 kDa heat shock protein [Stieleria varia]